MAPPPSLDIGVYADSDISATTIPDPLTINGIEKRRKAAGRLIAGTAALADIELFKGRIRHQHKPLARRIDCKNLPIVMSF